MRVNPTGDRAHNRSSFLRRASTLTCSRHHAKIPKQPTPQNLQQQRGAEIAMSRKQQPNSIESKTLITYNLKKEEGRKKMEVGKSPMEVGRGATRERPHRRARLL
ncbi:hypothetical protein QUB63_00370 [Microcoleus sp. ARI1-B5]|uniref:hypothetical protein n=1 Tax=unclassified Microcoleus TaxID=2642155 RepID=UPI002FD1D19B